MKTRSDIDFAAAARATNLLDPVAAQDAATKAYADSLTGWQELAVLTPGAVDAVDFPAIDPSYGDLRLVFEGVSHDSGASQRLTLAVSGDGVTFSAGALVSLAFPGSAVLYGSVEIPGYRLGAGQMAGAGFDAPTSPSAAAGGVASSWRCDGGIAALRVAWSAGRFDGTGTLRLRARR